MANASRAMAGVDRACCTCALPIPLVRPSGVIICGQLSCGGVIVVAPPKKARP